MGWDTCTKYKGVGDHASPSKYMNDFSRLEVQNKFMLKKKNPSVPHQMMTLFDVWISKFFFFFLHAFIKWKAIYIKYLL